MEATERLSKVENSTKNLEEMVALIVGDITKSLDDYMDTAMKCLERGNEISDADLEMITLQMHKFLYPLIEPSMKIEMKKGAATEHAKYTKNECILTYSGTVADKTARAENESAEDRLVELAYKTASSIIQKKMDSAEAILNSVKAIKNIRIKEKALTSMASQAVSSF